VRNAQSIVVQNYGLFPRLPSKVAACIVFGRKIVEDLGRSINCSIGLPKTEALSICLPKGIRI
jgi:hypothetical protein